MLHIVVFTMFMILLVTIKRYYYYYYYLSVVGWKEFDQLVIIGAALFNVNDITVASLFDVELSYFSQ